MSISLVGSNPQNFIITNELGSSTFLSPTFRARTETTSCIPCIPDVYNCGYGEPIPDPGLSYISGSLASTQYIECFNRTVTLSSLEGYPSSGFLQPATCIEQATVTAIYDYLHETASFQTGNLIYLQSFSACTTTVTYVAALTTLEQCGPILSAGAVNPLLDPNRLRIKAFANTLVLRDVPAEATPEPSSMSPSTPSPQPNPPIAAPTPSPTQPADRTDGAPDISPAVNQVVSNPAETPQSSSPSVKQPGNVATSPSVQYPAQVGNTVASPSIQSPAQPVNQGGNAATSPSSEAGMAAGAAASLAGAALPTDALAVQSLQSLDSSLMQIAATASGSSLSQIQASESSIRSALSQISASRAVAEAVALSSNAAVSAIAKDAQAIQSLQAVESSLVAAAATATGSSLSSIQAAESSVRSALQQASASEASAQASLASVSSNSLPISPISSPAWFLATNMRHMGLLVIICALFNLILV